MKQHIKSIKSFPVLIRADVRGNANPSFYSQTRSAIAITWIIGCVTFLLKETWIDSPSLKPLVGNNLRL